jgi:hypothetical protein
MRKALALATVTIGIGLLAGTAAVFGLRSPAPLPTTMKAVWNEAAWPFPIDQWGTGAAFVCQPADCGTRVTVYIRPKIGFCNCSTGVSDDAELERVSDTELVTRSVRARGASRPVKVGWMAGLSRSYRAAEGGNRDGMISVAFNDECDVVVALATTGDADPAQVEPAVVSFLQTTPMVLWAKKELGLEFVRRVW